MSLITEEQRQELEGKPDEYLIEMIMGRKPDANGKVIKNLVKTYRHALSKDRFDVLADLWRSTDEKAAELGEKRRTISEFRHFLISLGAVASYHERALLYKKEDLEGIDERFPTIDSLREAMNNTIKEGDKLALDGILKELEIAPLSTRSSLENHGVRYKAYDRLGFMLNYESSKGNIAKIKRDGKLFYKLMRKLPLRGRPSRALLYMDGNADCGLECPDADTDFDTLDEDAIEELYGLAGIPNLVHVFLVLRGAPRSDDSPISADYVESSARIGRTPINKYANWMRDAGIIDYSYTQNEKGHIRKSYIMLDNARASKFADIVHKQEQGE